MDEKENLTYFKQKLQIEIEDIEHRIKELKGEKIALSRQLAKARAERTGLQYATRKNSMNRILAENAIITALKESQKSLKTAQLFQKAKVTNFDLNKNTFRTYLNRMKKKGLIKSSRSTGYWELPGEYSN